MNEDFDWDCFWCKFGWPKPIHDIFKQAKERLEGDDHFLLFGPGHIVWSDENWDSAQWCLDNFDQYHDGKHPEEMAVVRWSLEELLKVPKEFKDSPPDYKIPNHWIMITNPYEH